MHRKNEIIASNKQVARQIRYACFLIERVEKGPSELCEKEMALFEEKWGLLARGFSNNKINFYFPKATTPEEKVILMKEFHMLQDLQDKVYLDSKKRLFKHLDRYLEKWWD